MSAQQARGIIFDFDGVLIDSEPLYLKSVNVILEECGVPQLSAEEYQRWIGSTATLTWQALTRDNNLPEPAQHYQDRYEAVIEGVLKSELTLTPEAEELLGIVERRSIPRGVATASRRKWLTIKLEKLGLTEFFDVAVCSTDVRRTKPAPDIYLKAAELMGLDPADAIAIEDSPAGIKSATGAGIRTIALRTGMTENLDISKADEIIDSLREFDVDRYFGQGAELAPTR
ncbi:MAG: HAD family phosphatase [Chloroflexi bacterium]|nr:HAD family phosphatase [Chloroflexota bacterium]